MKQLYFVAFLFITSLAAAQTDKSTRTTTAPSHPIRQIQTLTVQQEFDIAKQAPKDVVSNSTMSSSTGLNPAPSAEGAAAIRFKDVPVNLATGAMSLPIPIYTLSEGLLSVPISLEYNGSGMKNQEVASWCGAGWNINAGGMISRMVRGLPDEGVKNANGNYRGYYKFGFGGNGTSVENDTEPDYFYLNINGATYKMAYRHDGENAKFEFFPDADIKVIPTFEFFSGNQTVGRFVKFEVILSDGTQYTFGNGSTESTAEAEAGLIQSAGNYPGTTGFNTFWANNAQTSVWYLTQIKSVYGQEINFDYDHVQYSYYRIADHGVDGTTGVCPTPSQVTKEINRIFVNSVSLAKIRGVNTKVEINQRSKVCTFQYDPSSGDNIEVCEYLDLSNPRMDIDKWTRYPQNQSNAKRLNEIMVMENTNLPKDTLFYKFNYGHFFGVNNDLPAGYSENNPNLVQVGFTHQRRLRLEKIDFPDQTNVRFRYKGDGVNYNGKSRLDYGIDHWGYANGNTGNSLLTGLIPRDTEYPNCTPSTSNRDSDPAFGFYASLDSVVFANRKTIAFAYEMHTAKNYKDAAGNLKPIGGPRIKSIINKDLISGLETKKVYDYTLNSQTTGHLAIKPTYRYKTPFNQTGSHSSIYDRILGEMGRPPVVYSRVTERLLNNLNQGLGKTVYYFDNDTTALTTYQKYAVNCSGTYPNQTCDTVEYIRPERVHPTGINYHWNHKYQTGNLIRLEIFNENNDTLSVQSWHYADPIWNYFTTSASKLFRVNNLNIGAYLTNSQNNTYDFTEQYNLYFTKYRLKSQSTKTFSQSGTNPLSSAINYIYKDEMPNDYQQKYKGKHNQLVKTETTDSKGLISEQFIKYPADFEFGSDTIHYEQTCYDEYGSYDCSYDEFIAHVPQAGSQARGIFEFKFANIYEFPIETNAKYNTYNVGASYNVISSFTKPLGGFNFAPNKTFSSGNIGNFFTEMDYSRIPNDTITREPTYFLNNTILAFNDYGLPTASKPFGAAQSQQTFDASKLLITSQSHNIGGVVVDNSSMFYAKKLFGANRIIGINHLESIIVFDSTYKKGSVKQKLDKDRNILAQIDFFEPTENFVMAGISLDNSKYRTISRMPRIATQTMPGFGDNLDVDVSYSDADGRTIQNKSLRASPSRKDMIGATPIFDSFGRIQKSILPVNSTLSNGSLETNILAKAQTAYADTQPLSEVTQFEASPLSRAFKTIGVGAAFRPSKEGIQSFETGNFGILKNTVNGGYLISSTYIGNQITKSTSTDPNGNKSISFSDKEGRTLETWVQVSGDGSSPNHYLKTTYLYDYLNRPIAVIPPILYGQIPNGTYLLGSPYFNLLHYTVYDNRGRVVEKHTPDAGWSYFVYNRLGQLVLSQNARNRESLMWLWSKFGARGQSIMSGILTQSTYTRQQLQTLFDNYGEDKQFEERSSNATNEYYTTRSFPPTIQAFITNENIKTVAYFDDYSWNTNAGLNFSKYKTNSWTNAKGLMTGNKVRRLDTNVWLASTLYYDDKNRLIQSQSENRWGQVNQTDIVLDFIGQLLENRAIYRKTGSANLTISTKYTYDHAGRKLDATHFLTGSPADGKPELLASYEYDELGRLVQKNLNEASQNSITRNTPVLAPQVSDIAKQFILLQPGTCITGDSIYNAFIAAGLQKVNYQYDIRGNISCINCSASGVLDNSKVFSMKLDYHQDGRYFNGLLSRQTWKSSADTVSRKYLYDYDKANRFINATFTGKLSEKFNENTSYDANGNILKLNRFGKVATSSYERIDSLAYFYQSNSNKLAGIFDYSYPAIGFKDNSQLADYSYYPDGNLKSDDNKGITNIIYNYLGLQEEIIFSPTQKIKNVYASDGQKLIQYLINGSSTIKTDYIGELIYRNDTLQTIFHDEGRVRFDNGLPKYQYFIEDHLGNNRVVFEKLNSSTYIAQRTDYYPFGSPHNSENLQFKFLYQGKEYVDFLGLNQYDFHARGLDTWSGRFSGVDPVDNVSLSGYASMNNNPVSYIDPDGRNPIAIGAFIGIFANTVIKMAQNKPINNMWQFVSPGIVGAVGAGVGGAVLGSFSPMATSGAGSMGSTMGAYAASGAASGFVSGGLSAAFNGENIGRGAMFGALSGGAFGGMSGGIQYSSAHGYINNLPAFAQNGDPIYRGGNLRGVTVTAPRIRLPLNPLGTWGARVGAGLARFASILSLATIVEGDVPRKAPNYMLLYRNIGENEYSSFVRKGGNFGSDPKSLQVKEFWMTPDGLDFWNSTSYSKPYNVTISIPVSIVGPNGLVQVQSLDGHLAGVVSPRNMNSFNRAKVVVSVIKR